MKELSPGKRQDYDTVAGQACNWAYRTGLLLGASIEVVNAYKKANYRPSDTDLTGRMTRAIKNMRGVVSQVNKLISKNG